MINISLKNKWKNWLLKRFKVSLGISIDCVKIRLTPTLRLRIDGMSKQIYPNDTELDYVLYLSGNRINITNFYIVNFKNGIHAKNGKYINQIQILGEK